MLRCKRFLDVQHFPDRLASSSNTSLHFSQARPLVEQTDGSVEQKRLSCMRFLSVFEWFTSPRFSLPRLYIFARLYFQHMSNCSFFFFEKLSAQRPERNTQNLFFSIQDWLNSKSACVRFSTYVVHTIHARTDGQTDIRNVRQSVGRLLPTTISVSSSLLYSLPPDQTHLCMHTRERSQQLANSNSSCGGTGMTLKPRPDLSRPELAACYGPQKLLLERDGATHLILSSISYVATL